MKIVGLNRSLLHVGWWNFLHKVIDIASGLSITYLVGLINVCLDSVLRIWNEIFETLKLVCSILGRQSWDRHFIDPFLNENLFTNL